MVLSTICLNQNLQCDSTDCEEKGKVFTLYCQKEKEVLCTSVSYLADGIEAELTEEEEELSIALEVPHLKRLLLIR